MKNRNLTIDVFRALAIILVTGFHIMPFINNPSKPFLIFDFYSPFVNGDVGFALFIFISGYITQANSFKLSWREFIKKRFWRIALPYYIALLIWNIFMFTSVITGGSHNLIDNLMHIFFIHNLYPKTFYSISGLFWYIGLQVQLYLVYLCVRPFLEKHGWVVGITSLMICLVTNTFVQLLLKDYPSWHIVAARSIFTYAFLFFMGALIQLRREKVEPFLNKPFIFYSLCILAIVLIFLNGRLPIFTKIRLDQLSELIETAGGLILGLIMLGMPKISQDDIIFKPLILIGTASYSIYLYNFIFWTFAPQLYFIKGLAIYSLITIFFGMGMYYLVEQPIVAKKQVF